MKYSDTLLRYRGFQVADLVTDEQQQEVAQCKESVCECRRHKRCGFHNMQSFREESEVPQPPQG